MKSHRYSLEIPRTVSFLIVGQLVIKVLLVNWYRAEYTDAIIQLTLFENDNTIFPPLFSLLSRALEFVVVDPIWAGRLVSSLASSLTVIPVFLLGKRIWCEKTGLWASICYSISAIQWRWSVRAMTDPLFAFLFALSLYWTIEGFFTRNKNQACASLFFAGLATLTRYQGLILVPLVALGFWRSRKRQTGWGWAALSLIPWLCILGWLFHRGIGHGGQFHERAVGGITNVLLAYLMMAEGFIVYLPYALGYPLFGAMVLGLARGHRLPKERVLAETSLFIFIPWLLIHAAFQSFQYRYFLPLLPVLSVWAGAGVFRIRTALIRKGLFLVLVLWGVTFSGLVLYLQRDTFGDIRESAEFVKELEPSCRIFSDEVYRVGVENVKMKYWSARQVYSIPQNLRILRPGDVLVLHNTYSDFGALARSLQTLFEVEELFHVEGTICPLLPDIMTQPRVTSQPFCMAYRYVPQHFMSVVIVLKPLESDAELD